MTNEELIQELQAKIKELEWRNNVRSLELITWLNELIKKMEVKEEVKPITVEIKKVEEEVEEKKPVIKKKISFKKK